jgi:hypothetical protein
MMQMNGWGVFMMSLWLLIDLALGTNMPDMWRKAELSEALLFVTKFPQVADDLVVFMLMLLVCIPIYVFHMFLFHMIRHSYNLHKRYICVERGI